MELLTNPLSQLVLLPAAAGLLLLAVPERKAAALKSLALAAALLTLLAALRLYAGFVPAGAGMQFQFSLPWLPAYGVNYALGADGISLLLMLLTALLTPAAVLASFNCVNGGRRAYYSCLLFLEAALLGVFSALDLFVFYLFWEGMLIPMYFLIGVWGGPRRVHAALKFFICAAAGSALMLAAILWVAAAHYAQTGAWTFSMPALYGGALDPDAQLWLFAAFALAFAVKVPLFPFHTWLPDAQAEAPAAAGVLLAGVMLKAGIYGYLRLAVPLFPAAAAIFAPWLAGLSAAGMIYASLAAWSQKDICKMLAYSSVANLGLAMLGIMSFEPAAVSGAVLQLVNHGLSTGALLLLAGMLYERRHSRIMDDHGGLARPMPGFSAVFMLAALSAMGLPGLNGFVGEALILFGSFRVYPWLAGAAVAGLVLTAAYLLDMCRHTLFGAPRHPGNAAPPDLDLREWSCLLPLLFLILFIGVRPAPLLKRAETAVNNYVALARPQAAAPATELR